MRRILKGDRNLLRVARMLEKLRCGRNNEFDMRVWYNRGYHSTPCGTAACATGWACVKEVVPGLRFNELQVPQYKGGGTGWDAIRLAFDLDFNDADALFSASAHVFDVIPKAVAKKIREFVCMRRTARKPEVWYPSLNKAHDTIQ